MQVCGGVIHVVNGIFWPPSAQNREPTKEETVEAEPECESIYQVLLSSEETLGFVLDRIRLFPSLQERLNATSGSENLTLFAPTASEAGVIELVAEDDTASSMRASLERLIVDGDVAASELVPGGTLRSISVSDRCFCTVHVALVV